MPGFAFMNKEYGTGLEFNYEKGMFGKGWCAGMKVKSQRDLPLVGGNLGVWKFSRTYNTVPLEQEGCKIFYLNLRYFHFLHTPLF